MTGDASRNPDVKCHDCGLAGRARADRGEAAPDPGERPRLRTPGRGSGRTAAVPDARARFRTYGRGFGRTGAVPDARAQFRTPGGPARGAAWPRPQCSGPAMDQPGQRQDLFLIATS
ncbi:MAG: hypothetical protein LBT40_14840 [Deltaproteobacteria bacterium]|nr:hypothetical protein [Deltaproteobacteria bacterium]